MLPPWLKQMVDPPPPPQMRPHVQPRPQQVVIGDELPDIGGASKVAEHFYRQARKRGKSEADAAALARSQAMNFLHKIGIFKPQPDRYEY
jgi:hypothetical protein